MIPRRLQTHAAPQHAPASDFDRLTFTACMVTVAVFVAVITGYGPAAALQHLGEVLRAAATLPDASPDLYAATTMPF